MSLAADEGAAYHHTLHGSEGQVTHQVLVAVLILEVDALAVHQGEVVVEQLAEEFARGHEAQVAATGVAIHGVACNTRQVGHRLGVAVDEFHYRGGEGILYGEHRLELAHAHAQLGQELIFGIEFQQVAAAVEVVHEEAAPAVGNLSVGHEDDALDVEGVFTGLGSGVGVAGLCIARQGDALFQGIHYLADRDACLVLGTEAKGHGQKEEKEESVSHVERVIQE